MKINQPTPYMDHLLRQTRLHHVHLSMMADAKANMMLTVSAIVITLTIPRLTDPRFVWAAATLIGFCLVTIILAVCSALPKRDIVTGHGTKVQSDTFNLLFFGDFVKLTYPEFEKAMEEVLNNPSSAYEAQVREVYDLGVYLSQKKFRYVRLAYLAFLIGMLCSGGVFLITVMVRL